MLGLDNAVTVLHWLCPLRPHGKAKLHFLFHSRAGRRPVTKQRRTQQRKQPARVKADKNATALANKEEVPPLKKMRMYVRALLLGAEQGDTTLSFERLSILLKGSHRGQCGRFRGSWPHPDSRYWFHKREKVAVRHEGSALCGGVNGTGLGFWSFLLHTQCLSASLNQA